MSLRGGVADDDGGVFNYEGTLNVFHSIVSGNTAGDAGDEVYDDAGTLNLGHFNLFGHSSTSGVSGFSVSGTDIVPSVGLSAILSPLAANGGPTLTHALVSGSPAIDAVLSGCPPPVDDQPGFLRPVDGNGIGGPQCDSGAVEFNSLVPHCASLLPSTGCTVNGKVNQLCQGTEQPDFIIGTAGADAILGRGGNDTIVTGGGTNLVWGGTGNDLITGGPSSDGVDGEGGDGHHQWRIGAGWMQGGDPAVV